MKNLGFYQIKLVGLYLMDLVYRRDLKINLTFILRKKLADSLSFSNFFIKINGNLMSIFFDNSFGYMIDYS